MKPTHFQITKISKQVSRRNGHTLYAVFFKGDDGHSYKTWIDVGNGNYRRWENLLSVGNVLKSLNIKNGTLIDADSFPQLVSKASEHASEAEM